LVGRISSEPDGTASSTVYEAFIRIVDSMFSQHAKWLKVCESCPWRRQISSLNYLLASHVWQQDHNGFTQPGSRVPRPRYQQEG